MTKKIFIRAVDGRTVRDPVTKAILSSAFVQKDDNAFWRKRISQGDVELKTEVISVETDNKAYLDSRKQDVKENLREKKDGNIQ